MNIRIDFPTLIEYNRTLARGYTKVEAENNEWREAVAEALENDTLEKLKQFAAEHHIVVD